MLDFSGGNTIYLNTPRAISWKLSPAWLVQKRKMTKVIAPQTPINWPKIFFSCVLATLPSLPIFWFWRGLRDLLTIGDTTDCNYSSLNVADASRPSRLRALNKWKWWRRIIDLVQSQQVWYESKKRHCRWIIVNQFDCARRMAISWSYRQYEWPNVLKRPLECPIVDDTRATNYRLRCTLVCYAMQV